MAEAILANRMRALAFPLRVHSAGLGAMGGPADEMIRTVLLSRGFEYGGHESTRVTHEAIDRATLVLAMERRHVVDIATTVPGSFAKTFGLTEVVALGDQYGGRRPDESIAAWIRRLQVDRHPRGVLKFSPDFDVADPHGGPPAGYERCADQLTQLIDALVVLLFGTDAR